MWDIKHYWESKCVGEQIDEQFSFLTIINKPFIFSWTMTAFGLKIKIIHFLLMATVCIFGV